MEYRFQCRAAFLAMEIERLLDLKDDQRWTPPLRRGDLDFNATIVEDEEPLSPADKIMAPWIPERALPAKPLAKLFFRTVTEGDTKLIVEIHDPSFKAQIEAALEGVAEYRNKGASPVRVEQRGTKSGTLERVREAHRLLRDHYLTGRKGRTQCILDAGTDPRTYEDRCVEATGEEPIRVS